jgi:hypothetical protein
MRRLAFLSVLSCLLAGAASAIGSLGSNSVPVYSWPSPSFQASGLAAWLDATNSTYTAQDAVLPSAYSTSIAAVEDISGNGNGFDQPFKAFQPTVDSVTGGMSFAAGQFMPCIVAKPLAGASQVTVGLVFSAQSVAGSAYRTVLSADQQVWIYIRSGALTVSLRPSGAGSVYSATGAALTTGVKHQLIAVADLVAGTLSVTLDGSAYASTTWTPGTTAFTTPTAIMMGNYYTTPLGTLLDLSGGGTDEPMLGGVSVLTLHTVALNSGAIATLQTYLGSK